MLTPDAVSVPARDRRLGEAFVGLFTPDHPQDWARGLDAAMALGRAGLPLLADLAEREAADTRRRLLLLSAASVGGGHAADSVLFHALERAPTGVTGVQERFVIGLTLALGGARVGAAPVLAALSERPGLKPIERVAIAAAMARFPDGVAPPPSWYDDEEAALVAAACLAREPADRRFVERWLARDVRHGDLVRRGYLLGAKPGRFERARAERLAAWLGEGGEEAEALRVAVAVHLARVPDPDAWLDGSRLPLDGEILPILAAEPGFRDALYRRGLLEPLSARLPLEFRSRVAVAFGLATDAAGLERTADEWRGDEVVGRALCLAIAWRFLIEPERADAGWTEHLPDVREAEWVRLACGRPPREPARPMRDDRLDRAFLIAVDSSDRLDRASAAHAIEDALWRAGIHPAVNRHFAERDLLRDLLLAGSTYGSAVLGLGTDPRGRNLPGGLSQGDAVFEIGYEIYRYFRAPGPKRPDWVRLR